MPARVVLPGVLKQYTNGETEFQINAENIHQVFRQLGERFPSLAPHLKDGLAVAINGNICQDALFEPIPNDSEVHLIPKIAGGSEARGAIQ